MDSVRSGDGRKGYWRVKRSWKIVNQYEPSRLDYNSSIGLAVCFDVSEVDEFLC